MDQVVESIYKSCDPENTNNVPVISLVEFVRPFMLNNPNELVELQSKLDPDGSNPHVDYNFFQSVMSDWIANIQGQDVNNSLSEVPFNLSQNVPIHSNNNNKEELRLEEQVDSLKQQLNKVSNELELAKMQLAACEDQNELLVADLASHSNSKDKELCSKARCEKISRENDEIQERVLKESKKCEQLERIVLNHKKEEDKWLSRIAELKHENASLSKKIASIEKSRQDDRKFISSMNETLDVKDSEISTLMEVICDLKNQVEEKTCLVNYYVNEHKFLKQKTRELETSLKNSIPCNAPIYDDFHTLFNSPKLLRQLERPLSPISDSPLPQNFGTSTPRKSTNVLRKPHKSLKEELAETSFEENDEVNKLKKVIKEHEAMNDKLWDNMKTLSKENKILLEIKKKQTEQELYLRNLEKESVTRKQTVVNNDEKMKTALIQLTSDLSSLENHIKLQKLFTLKAKKKLTTLGRTCKVIVNREVRVVQRVEFDRDRSTQTEPFQETQTDTRKSKTNHTKQQMQIERLLEKQETLEKHLSNERSINTKMCTEVESYKKNVASSQKQLRQQSAALQQLESDNNTLANQVKELRTEVTNMATQILELNRNLADLKSEKEILQYSLQNAFAKLSEEEAKSAEFRAEKDLLVAKNFQLEAKVNQNAVVLFHLAKKEVDSKKLHDFVVKQLHEELDARKNEISVLKQRLDTDVDFFSTCNNDLRRSIMQFFDCCMLEGLARKNYNIFEEYSQSETHINSTGVENQAVMLKDYISTISYLLKDIHEIISNNASITESTSFSDEDDEMLAEESFATSCSDISSFAETLPEIIIPECEFFLDGEDTDWGHLSREEMDEKFANLALVLTVDVGTQRLRNSFEKFHQLTIKFFSHLNYSIHLLSNCSNSELKKTRKIVQPHLRLLRDLGEAICQSAMKCGVLHYEKRTANCWKSIINYVAILNQENKQRKINVFNQWSTDGNTVVGTSRVPSRLCWSCCPSLTFWFNSLILVLVFFVTLLLYVEHSCSKTGRWLCPLQWILSLFIEKTHLK